MKMNKILTQFVLCAAIFATSMAFAGDRESLERIAVESRAVSMQEKLEVQEARFAEQQSAKEMQAQDQDDEMEAIEKSLIHPGIYHAIWGITPLNDIVELEDGSQWTTRVSDRYKVASWYSNDLVHVEQNSDLFSSFPYRIVNDTTLNSAASHLTAGPFYHGTNSHWILGVDVIAGTVLLEDGSYWLVSSSDMITLLSWIYDDTVIIGLNSDWFTFGDTYILINVNTNTYVRCAEIL